MCFHISACNLRLTRGVSMKTFKTNRNVKKPILSNILVSHISLSHIVVCYAYPRLDSNRFVFSMTTNNSYYAYVEETCIQICIFNVMYK